MRSLLTVRTDKNNDNNRYDKKYIKIGDEKTWKVYIKK